MPKREDWALVKRDIMLDILRLKFATPFMRDKLNATGERPLVEGNTWGDTYWGVCRGRGENHLGKILMQIRTENRS